MNNYNELTLPMISKYVNPIIATQITLLSVKELHKVGIHAEGKVFDFIKYVEKSYHGLKQDFASFRNRKSNQFFKRIWLYTFVSISAMFSYNKTRYGLLIKNEKLEDNLMTKVTFDYFWEVLSKTSLPVMTETFETYLEIVKQEGALFAIERMYEITGIDRTWLWLENHIKERIGKT